MEEKYRIVCSWAYKELESEINRLSDEYEVVQLVNGHPAVAFCALLKKKGF